MNELSNEKFLTLFDEILNYQEGSKIATMFPTETSGDEVDKFNILKEQQLYERLNGRNILFLKKVEKAKQKILDGTFGSCEDCECDIGTQRLAARPTANLCITCQEDKERTEHGSIKHRRDLKLVSSKATKALNSSEPDGFSSYKDIKFESIVDM